jgi:hypothetical protein
MTEDEIRKIVRQELSRARFFFGDESCPPPPTPEPAPEQPTLDLIVPKWQGAYTFKPFPVGKAERTTLEWLAKHQHSGRWLPDFTHNPLTHVPEVMAPNTVQMWSPPKGAPTLWPFPTPDTDVSSVNAMARCFAVVERLSPKPQRFLTKVPCQGLIGDVPPIPAPAWVSTHEWSCVPLAWLSIIKMSSSHGLRPLDGCGRHPLPAFFEPINPYSIVVQTNSDWAILCGPRAPSFGRKTLVQK